MGKGHINELGEVQALGREVDRLCTVVDEKALTLAAVRAMRSAAGAGAAIELAA